jgi:Spy/CpxP family protein refolding chaperone
MNENRFAKRVAVAAGFFFLCAAPGLTRAQSSPPTPVPTPRKISPTARPKKNAPPPDDFAGLTYTDDQKAKIGQIHEDMKGRMDNVVKDEKLIPEQKGAMLDGYRRMEYRQVFGVLTPEQQKEVREKVRARRAAEQEEKKKQQSPPK